MAHSEDAVEQVAEAIWRRRKREMSKKLPGLYEQTYGTVTLRDMAPFTREPYLADARAALDAIDALYADEVTL